MDSVVIGVAWNVSLSPNTSSVLNPATANASDEIPVIVPSVQACLAKSYCKTLSDVVAPATENTSHALDIDADEPLNMPSYELKLDATGDYVVLASAAVPSHDLVITNVVFQKVRTTVDGSTATGTIKPPPAGFMRPVVISRPTARPETAAPAPPTTPTSSHLGSLDGHDTAVAASSLVHHSATNALVVAAIAMAGIVVAAVVLAAKRRRERANQWTTPRPRAETTHPPVGNHRSTKCAKGMAVEPARGSSIEGVAILQSASSLPKWSPHQPQATPTGNWHDVSRAYKARRPSDDEAFSF